MKGWTRMALTTPTLDQVREPSDMRNFSIDQLRKTVDTEPVVKGQTAASSNKPAKMDNGVRVMVPPFISIGDKIVVETNEIIYLRRAD